MRRSALNEEDLSLLLPSGANGSAPAVVFGSQATGITDVIDLLAAVARDRDLETVLMGVGDVGDFVSRSRRGRSDGPVALVDACDASGERLDQVLSQLAGGGSHRGAVVVAGPSAADGDWVEVGETGVLVVPLRKWTDEGLRACSDSPFPTPSQRSALLDATGGWPALVEEATARAQNGEPVDGVVEGMSLRPHHGDEARAFLASVGLDLPRQSGLLQVWSSATEPGEAVSLSDLAAIAEQPEDVVLGQIKVLRLLQAADYEEGLWTLDRVVQRAVTGR